MVQCGVVLLSALLLVLLDLGVLIAVVWALGEAGRYVAVELHGVTSGGAARLAELARDW